jgi:SAM-dependent methyltransferase
MSNLSHLPLKTPKETVREGYDKLAAAYRAHYAASHDAQYGGWLDAFERTLTPGGRVLELGCADGIPVAKRLSPSYDYLGVDISPVQIAAAGQNVPGAHFQVADMTELAFPDGQFGGIVALYSLIHVPVAQQVPLIGKMARWLQPGGALLATVGHTAWTGTEDNWIVPCATMYWSHADTATYLAWFAEAGFTVLRNAFVPEGNGGHTLLLLRREGAG